MSKRYILRLDDACPTMNFQNWNRILGILDRYAVKPLVGVIPNNQDPSQKIDNENPDFWNLIKFWEDQGCEIALHGYNHVYSSSDSGIFPFWNKSEFAGLPLQEQKEKIHQGLAILKSHKIKPRIFFAPSHTLDINTLIALKETTDIRIISDGIAITPFRINDFVFFPQICGHCRNIPLNGIFTFCYHPNTMSERDFIDLENFLCKNYKVFSTFSSIIKDNRNIRARNVYDKLIHNIYFLIRKMRYSLKKLK